MEDTSISSALCLIGRAASRLGSAVTSPYSMVSGRHFTCLSLPYFWVDSWPGKLIPHPRPNS
jgi:hypothetical protein